MNFFEDAFRFFGNMNKEASAKHILIKGDSGVARQKLQDLKAELETAEDLSAAFSDLAAQVSQCPSANRGGNLGTFKPGMMVKESTRYVPPQVRGSPSKLQSWSYWPCGQHGAETVFYMRGCIV